MLEIVWFKRDLRIHDHAPLAAAAASGRPVLPLFILEPELWAQPEFSGRHFAFLRESLADLDSGLTRLGARLVLRVGDAVEVLASLHRAHGIATIRAHEETGLLWTYARDRAVRSWARRAGIPVVESRQHGVWRAQRSRDGWARRWDLMMEAAPVAAPAALRFADLPSDVLPDADALGLAADPCPDRQAGGRAVAVGLLRSFLDTRGRTYRRDMASPAAGAASCARISAHLALGCISIREANRAALRAQTSWRDAGDGVYAASIASFRSRLHWHCHFIQKLEDEPGMEREALHPACRDLRPIAPDHAERVDAWATGRTGFPFVDACMRSLAASGWLNFRMRAMAMAFASYHLWQDWRLPAQRLARLFTDFEPGIHYPQVQMQSGVTGTNTARIYNPVKQSRDQDPEGAFIRRHVPELARLPDAFLHEPWRASAETLAASGIVLGRTYPLPLVDHVLAAAEARQRVYGVRGGAAFRAEADAIQSRHGSRRSGLPPTARVKPTTTVRRKRTAVDRTQGVLDLTPR
jgi:deoxyribodipyrimidine photo-lyase